MIRKCEGSTGTLDSSNSESTSSVRDSDCHSRFISSREEDLEEKAFQIVSNAIDFAKMEICDRLQAVKQPNQFPRPRDNKKKAKKSAFGTVWNHAAPKSKEINVIANELVDDIMTGAIEEFYNLPQNIRNGEIFLHGIL